MTTDLHDSFFGAAFTDVDEWRSRPVPHRYVHGGFAGTDTRFSFYFPPAEQHLNRFLHYIEGGSGGHESTAGDGRRAGSVDFAVSCGAYLVESNQGHFGGDLSILRTEPTVHAFRASIQSARYAKTLAASMYGSEPVHGYVFGGSGGSPRTIMCLERAPDLYDGAIPYIMGHANSWSLGFSVQANAARILAGKMDAIVDAMAPGGSGDPFADLSTAEREALAALYRSGLPRGAEQVFSTSGFMGTFAAHISALVEFDPTYVDDFWTLPGYMGGDGHLAGALVEEKATVQRVVSARELRERFGPDADQGRMRYILGAAPDDAALGVVIDGVDVGRALGVSINFRSGGAAGHELQCVAVLDDVLIGSADTPYRFEGASEGDEVLVDNRKFLAYCYFHRHQVDGTAAYDWYRVDQRPMYPQRPLFSESGLLSGDTPTGELTGKMIVLQHALDAATLPNAAVAWRDALAVGLGDQLDEHFRLWFMDNASHVPASSQAPTSPPPTARLIDYQGCLEQAVRDLIAWVEHDRAPAPSTSFDLNRDQKLTLEPDPARRGGIQPVVTVRADGGPCASTEVGRTVTFTAIAEAPTGGGFVIAVEWDLEGSGAWQPDGSIVDGRQPSVRANATHEYTRPGVYFAGCRVTSHRNGDVNATHARVTNLHRVRVTVTQ